MNDQLSDGHERAIAQESVRALSSHVETAAAWTTISHALDRAPRARMRRRAIGAATVLSAVVIVGALVVTRTTHDRDASVEVSPTVPALADCVLPALPTPGASTAELALAGPAVSALKGGAALAPFSLDGGKFSVTPPSSGDRPLVTARQAECAALASINSSGNSNSPLGLALGYGGAAVGYGRVTIAPELIAHPAPNLMGQTNENTKPFLPRPTAYQHRLAWLVVVRNVLRYNGPPGGSPIAKPGPTQYGYAVFVIDAQTGSDAVTYTESQPGPGRTVAPSVGVPVEEISVPWTLVSRSPNGFTGTIRATVLPCDGYPKPVSVDRTRTAVAVVVQRPFVASCGESIQVTLPLTAATVTSDLPTEIAHDPVGPVVALESGTPTPTDPSRVLRLLNPNDNGTTITMTIGSVVVLPRLNGANPDVSGATSSDPDTVGGLDGSAHDANGEFRAWQVGRADLTIPTSACAYPKSNVLPCTGAWTVHVIVG